MKKTLFLLLIVMMLFNKTTRATNLNTITDETVLLKKGESVLLRELEIRGYHGENFDISILYDSNNKANFLLGSTENGYVIIDTGNFETHESGTLNPYFSEMSKKKYYGGALQYYVTNDNRIDSFKHLISNEKVTKISNVKFNNQKLSHIGNLEQLPNSNISYNSSSRLAGSYSNIQRRAFGYNNNNTCSAVAVGIALNYITYYSGRNFVPTHWRSEFLDKGLPTSYSSSLTLYPKATKFHKYISDNFGMGAVSYAESIKKPLQKYIDKHVNKNYNLTLNWTLFPNYLTIENNISSNKPVLITTTIAGEYSWHTMLVYGTKKRGNLEELLVHTGWYPSKYNSKLGGTKYNQNEVWINKRYATYGYYFNYK